MTFIRRYSQHYHKPPDHITEEELRQYFLYLKNVRKYSPAASIIALCGIKFFFERTLERNWTTFNLARPSRAHKLPVILSIEEVQRISDASGYRGIESA
ncbi:MAG: phage integrase N-terminal SAM-like domain-containing protein [Acidobacteriota bacterium]